MNIADAGAFKHKIQIVSGSYVKDASGFKTWTQSAVVIEPYAIVKTTKGFTLIVNNTDFEKAENGKGEVVALFKEKATTTPTY